MKKVVAIIQARMGSTRLPGKVLLDIQGKTVLEHVVDRVSASKLVQNVVVATTVDKNDLEIVKLCSNKNISVYCGSEKDVLDRYYQTARLFKADHVVRITSDCPMIDPEIIDEVISLHLKEHADYTSNTLKETYPDGEDVEIFTFDALETSWKKANLTSEREHVTPFMKKRIDLFKHASMVYPFDLSKKRWTLDRKEDFAFITSVYDSLYSNNHHFGIRNILEFVEKNTDIEKINQHIVRNEGYLKSIREDKKSLMGR